jgi:Fe-S-cluster containining protein
MDEALRQKVFAIYNAAEKDIAAAGPVCVASGRCCRFAEWGHTLFLSNLEADVLLSGAPPYEQPVTAEFCPFQKEKLCTAREHRPLGCRVYYCDPTYQETGNQITEKYLRELKDLAERENVDWQYAPLHVFLNGAHAGDAAEPQRGGIQ